ADPVRRRAQEALEVVDLDGRDVDLDVAVLELLDELRRAAREPQQRLQLREAEREQLIRLEPPLRLVRHDVPAPPAPGRGTKPAASDSALVLERETMRSATSSARFCAIASSRSASEARVSSSRRPINPKSSSARRPSAVRRTFPRCGSAW